MNKFKAEIKITLREGILDVQGKTVENALGSMQLSAINHIRIGKYVTLNVEANDINEALEIVDKACHQLIANPIMEDYIIDIKEA